MTDDVKNDRKYKYYNVPSAEADVMQYTEA